jgi:hypothetical protein
LIVAFVITSILQPQGVAGNSDGLSGAMFSTDMSNYEILAEYELGEQEKEGHVTVARDERQVIIEFRWSSREPVQAKVYFDEEWLNVNGTQFIDRPDNFRTTTTENEVELSGSGVIKQYVALGRREVKDDSDENEINFDVRSGNRSLLSRSLRIRNR